MDKCLFNFWGLDHALVKSVKKLAVFNGQFKILEILEDYQRRKKL